MWVWESVTGHYTEEGVWESQTLRDSCCMEKQFCYVDLATLSSATSAGRCHSIWCLPQFSEFFGNRAGDEQMRSLRSPADEVMMSVCATKRMFMTGTILPGGARTEATDWCILLARVLCESCLRVTPSSWWAPQPGVGRRVSLLNSQTVCTMGDRSLKHGPKAPWPPFHTAVCHSSLRELYYTYSPGTSFAVFPLRSPSLPSITRRAQGCKQAGCRRTQE